jgi:hypothetical protein
MSTPAGLKGRLDALQRKLHDCTAEMLVCMQMFTWLSLTHTSTYDGVADLHAFYAEIKCNKHFILLHQIACLGIMG